MMIMYENDVGRIAMYGNGGGRWNVIEVTGLGFPGKNTSLASYAGQDGQEMLSEVMTARTITIKGDIANEGSLPYELSRAIQILHRPGVLTVADGGKRRKISCRVNAFEAPDRNRVYQPFILQLIADNPAFEDVTSSIPVFLRDGQIKSTFTFPLAFTLRTNAAEIINNGDLQSEPSFAVRCLSGGTGTPTTEDAGIEIANTTTGQTVRLLYSPASGEVVTIDVANRRIVSDKPTEDNNGGNLIGYISDDTFLSNFWLAQGVNNIICNNLNSGTEIVALCEFSNRYMEAVF